jgi:hypothetical protein
MPDIFTPVILQLKEIGAFNFLFPFFLTSAIFYGLLRKSQIFGPAEKNTAVNSIISLVASFMVWAFPVIQGVNIEAQLSAFFMQGLAVSLVFMVALMLSGMIFKENLSEQLSQILQGNKGLTILLIAIGLGMVIFVSSGLFNLIISPDILSSIPTDVLLALGVIILLILPLLLITSGGGTSSGGGKAT